MKTVFELLNHDNTISVNRRLAHALGLAESVIYAALLAKHEWYAKNGKLSGGWFYCTIEDMEESTALSGKIQRRCMKKLEAAGLIMCRQVGLPQKRYFFIVDSPSLLMEICGSEESGERSGREHTEMPEGNVQKCPKVTISDAERSQKTKVNKTKENKPEFIKQDSAREQISHGRLSERYGSGFADLAAEVTAEGVQGAFQLTTDGRTVSKEDVSSVYRRVDYGAVCHVADYISGRSDIRNIKAYLRCALYTAATEVSQKPSAPAKDYNAPLWDDDPIDESILEELRSTYGAPSVKPSGKDYNAPLF